MSAGTRIKLCGMFREEDIAAVNAAQPDYVGFVVDFPRSHRSVTAERLAELSALVDAGITRVGVFVDEPVEAVAQLFKRGAIDMAQLHGHEDEEYLARLRALCDVLCIQAFRVQGPQDIARAEASSADLVLLDNGQGTGETFDWSLVQEVCRPFLLAGGLTPQNVTAAIEAVHPWGVDMSTGIETNRIKDPDKIKAAVAAARGFVGGDETPLTNEGGVQ